MLQITQVLLSAAYFLPSIIQSSGGTPLSPEALEKQSEFDRQSIPPRPVHMEGAGAYGTFTVTTKIAQSQTMMSLFSREGKLDATSTVGQKTPVVVRFSNALGEKGTFDTARNVRGFAVKSVEFFRALQHNKFIRFIFVLGLETAPIFYVIVRDPAKFPPLIQSQGRNPKNNLGDADTTFNYFPNNPETMNLFLRIFSSSGTSRGQCSSCISIGWIHSGAWCVNTYRWYKSDGTWSYVRINLEPKQGVLNFTTAELSTIMDPSYGARVSERNSFFRNRSRPSVDLSLFSDDDSKELYYSIQSGQFPRWTMFAQVLSPEDAEKFRYNVLDDTKEWPTSLVVPQEIGVLELNKVMTFVPVISAFLSIAKTLDGRINIPDNPTFSPANVVPGWAPSQDPVLQMRLFAYSDSSVTSLQRHRLGIVNDARQPVRRSLPIGKLMGCEVKDIESLKCRFITGTFSDCTLLTVQPPNIVAQNLNNFAQSVKNPSPIPGSATAAPASNSDSPVTAAAAPNYDSGHSLWINQALASMNQISPIDFEQPSFYYGNLTQDQKSELIQNVAGGLSVVSSPEIQTSLISWLAKASPDLSREVASMLKRFMQH
ncbi:hypothetical protein VP01_592g14 [Puccinia sorghi]|uniref:Catalase core domain-containing protein n=1 Tax=Puccinia sorghi TaxID=27349 RepID=A0A0L6UHS6_9BASI|nr:hypothetical protein VP01_592g14 [Puccinia sorghi]